MQPIQLDLSVGRASRHRTAHVSVSLIASNYPVMAAPAGAPIPASLLPKESLRLEKFDGNSSDRRHCASWLRRAERIFGLLGYDDDDNERKLFFVSTSLPNVKPSGRWYDSKMSTVDTQFADWDDFRQRFLVRFGPTTADLNLWEQEFQRMSQSNLTVHDFSLAIDSLRDVLGSSARVFDDVAVRQIFVAGLRSGIRQHVNSHLAVDNALSYERCVEIANSHVDSDRRAPTPRLQGIDGSERPGTYCAYHKVTTHSTDDCSVVKKLKAAGKWRGKPRQSK